MDNTRRKIIAVVIGKPKVVFIHLRHPASDFLGARVIRMSLTAGMEVGYKEIWRHGVGHLRDDVLVERVIPVSSKELCDLHVRLNIWHSIWSTLDGLPELLLAAVIGQAILVLVFAFGLIFSVLFGQIVVVFPSG